MSFIPRYVLKGQPVTADAFNKLIDFCRSNQPRPGPGIKINENTSGCTISAKPQQVQQSSGGKVDIVHPFKITDASDEDGAKIKVRWGMVNIIEIMLEDGITLLNTDPIIELDTEGVWVVFLEFEVEDDVTLAMPADVSCKLRVETSGFAFDGDPSTIGYQVVGEVTVTEAGDPPLKSVTKILQNVTHGLRHSICDRVAFSEDPSVDFNPGSHVFWGI